MPVRLQTKRALPDLHGNLKHFLILKRLLLKPHNIKRYRKLFHRHLFPCTIYCRRYVRWGNGVISLRECHIVFFVFDFSFCRCNWIADGRIRSDLTLSDTKNNKVIQRENKIKFYSIKIAVGIIFHITTRWGKIVGVAYGN